MLRQPCVYILASKRNGTLYTGMTGDLAFRIFQHKSNKYKGFTNRYGVNKLVWYELHATMEDAIAREKQIKFWKRRWKIELITSFNPEWRDLYDDLNN